MLDQQILKSRNEEPNTESSWIAVLVLQTWRDTEVPHCVHMAAEELEDPMYVYFGKVVRLCAVSLLTDDPIQVAEVFWAKQSLLDQATSMWVISTEPTNANTDEPFVPIHGVIPVAVAKDTSDHTVWILNCRVSRHVEAIICGRFNHTLNSISDFEHFKNQSPQVLTTCYAVNLL